LKLTTSGINPINQKSHEKVIIQFILSCFILLASLKIYSQEITIDSIFNSNYEIFPFDKIDNIWGISMEGDAHLNSDTSLVRVILVDDQGVQYMIFETYPLICPGLYTWFPNHCDETCFLDNVNPSSIAIHVVDAILNLKSFYYNTDTKENASEERYKAKRSLDAQKIDTMNKLIPTYNMNWVASDNPIVALYYDQKRRMFGDEYDLRGYEYYYDGVFEFLGHRIYPRIDPEMVKEFDWRNRHGVNEPGSSYYNGDIYKAGWLTKAKNQGVICNSCWAFAAAGVTEAIANLYSGQHLDYDLSEQDLLSCGNSGDCDGGYVDKALTYIKNHGIVTETCFPYYQSDSSTLPCSSTLKCQNPDTLISIFDTLNYNTNIEKNYDSIRKELIINGPLSISFTPSAQPHAVVLSGYKFDFRDSALIWIIKDSHWNGGPDFGFRELKLDNLMSATAAITPVYHNDTALNVGCHDYDHDGYCFWGIGLKPASCDTCDCQEEEDCDDHDSLVGGYDENYNCRCIIAFDSVPHHICADTTWSDTTRVSYQVIVDSGACLTIISYASFAQQARIVVKPGAKLILDGGHLTKACPADLWGGIEVWGSDTVQAFEEYFGKVVIMNNSIIEFAKIGVANHCPFCGYYSMHSGGIIVAQNSTFRDNETDVMFAPFQNYWFGREYGYRGGFTKCNFITTDNFYPEHTPKAHVEMKDVYAVQFSGCEFRNESNISYYPFPIRGKGISSIDANFMLLVHCNNPNIVPCNDLDSCRFSLLECGIKALNARSKRTLYINSCKFDSNFLAVSLSGIEYSSVLSNHFHCPESIQNLPQERFAGGLFMEGCTGYHVENNDFFAVFNGWQEGKSPCYGIGVKNSGPFDNEIYNNSFTKLSVGIYSIGENRGRESGLCLKCNDMISNKNDFIIVDENDPPLGTYQGIRRYQGDPNDSASFSAPAGNTFTKDMGPADSLLIKNYNYFNRAEDIFYSHHFSTQFQVRPMENHYTSSTIELKGWQDLDFDKATACPSGLGGGGSLKSYSSPRLTIYEADIQMDILKFQLDALIDGGNTEALNVEVRTSMPDEGIEIRQELLDASPYLSDTVLKQAIYQEDVLPNAMVRDIMEANPQSAKSDEILNTLESRYEPMPDYMMAQILQGKKYLGAKEVIESKIQSWGQIRSKAKGDLMREFLLDTNIISPSDSVLEFLENEASLDSRYDLALAQWNNYDLVAAWETLNMIPLQFAIDDIQIEDHENYLSYFDILQSLADSNLQASQLDSVPVSILFDLKKSGNPKISAQARGLLVKGGFFKYIETINFPNLTKTSKIHPDQYPVKTTSIKEDKLWLFPNPAGDYVIANYDLDPKNKTGEIHLVDLKGDLLKSYHIKSGKDQIVIDLKAFPNGIYLFSLNSRNQVIDSKKLNKGGN
jgi:hypothetical protein